MRNRLVVVYKEIDENNNVVNEWQQAILAAQEPHHHIVHHHNNHHTKMPIDTGNSGDNEIENPPPIEVPTTLDLNIVLDLQDKDYTANDFMARVCANANEGFDDNPWLAQDGGWYKSETHKLVVPIQANKKYFVRLATPPNPTTLPNGETLNQFIVISENGAVAEDWAFEHLANGLDVYTKYFDGIDTFPVITLKN